MTETNGAVSITNTSVTIVDHYSNSHTGGHTYCGQTSDPSGQGKAIIRLEYDQYNRNSDIMDTNSNECNRMTRQTAQPKDRDSESQFTTQTASVANTGSTSNGSGNALHVGRGKHRLKQNRSATRADSSAYVCATLAAPVVPVSQRQSQASNSAFDNKAFSCDGDSVSPELRTQTQTQNIGTCLQTNRLSVNRNQTLIELNSEDSTINSSQTSITDRLINNENINNCVKSSDNKQKNCFMKTNNETESTLKGQQYCSSSDINRQVIRSRSTRSARSSVVKHIGVFYSDLCDVIKAMRSGTQTNSNINNNCNTNTTNVNTNCTQSQPQPVQTSATNHRTNISAPVLLQNDHLMNNTTVPVPHQQSQQQTAQTLYPIQQQLQAITCLQTNPIQTHLMSGNTTLRSPSQSQLRLNETPVHDLPDILNSHLPPPPYSTLPPGLQLPPLSSLPPLVERGRNTPIRAPPPPPPPPPLPVAGRPPLPSRRILHAPTAVLAHCSRPNYLRPTCAVSETETSASKTCLSCNGVSIRWFILLIAFIGLLCAIIGTILGALRTTGREHLTLALLMIGVGIILITVSGIAWRLTSSGPTWRSILGLHELHPQQSLCNGSSLNDTSRRFVPRVPAPYGRTGTHHHPYGAMFYPEFQYRPPPPSYQASMQEYRLRLLLLDRSSSHPQSTSLSPVSPPPTYRSSAASSLTGTLTRQSQCNTIQRAPSRPPSYRAMTGVVGQPIVSTTPSFQSSTTQTPQSLPSPTAITPTTGVSSTLTTSQTQTQVSNPSKSLTQKASHQSVSAHHDINRVTILQTTNTSQVCTPNGVNIVAISPTNGIIGTNTVTTTTAPNLSAPIVSSNEVQILAHV